MQMQVHLKITSTVLFKKQIKTSCSSLTGCEMAGSLSTAAGSDSVTVMDTAVSGHINLNNIIVNYTIT